MLRVGKFVLPREELKNWLFDSEWPALKTHIQVTLYKLSLLFIFRNVHVYPYTRMHVTVINEKWMMNLKGSVWEGMEGGKEENKQ